MTTCFLYISVNFLGPWSCALSMNERELCEFFPLAAYATQTYLIHCLVQCQS